jgi:hypothetical protein
MSAPKLQVHDLAITYPGPHRCVPSMTLEPGRHGGRVPRDPRRIRVGQVHPRAGAARPGHRSRGDRAAAAGWGGVAGLRRTRLARRPVAPHGPGVPVHRRPQPCPARRRPDRRGAGGPHPPRPGRGPARVEELLTRVGLGPWTVPRYPQELSGGQRRLCLLAMGMACDPDVLILDEPTAGLDPFRREQVLELLANLRSAGPHAADVHPRRGGAGDPRRSGWCAVPRLAGRARPGGNACCRTRGTPTPGGCSTRTRRWGRSRICGASAEPRPTRPSRAIGCPFRERCTQVDRRLRITTDPRWWPRPG